MPGDANRVYLTNPKNEDQARDSKWHSLSIGFEDFRELLSPAQRGPDFPKLQELDCNKELSILETEFHLIRQILMLMNRFLDDLALVMSRLRHFAPEQLFDLFFENGQSGSSFDVLLSSPGVGNQTGPSEQFAQAETLSKKQSKQTFVRLGERYSRSNFTMRSSDNKDSLYMKTNATKPKLTSLDQIVSQPLSESSEKAVRMEQLKWFLTKQKVIFLEEDLVHVFRAFGSKSESISLPHFERMVQSTIWRL